MLIGFLSSFELLCRLKSSNFFNALVEQIDARTDVWFSMKFVNVPTPNCWNSRNLLCRAVHVWPESSKLRRALAVFYLHFGDILKDPRSAETVARCAEIAAGLGRNESSGSEMACLVGIGQTLSRSSQSGLKSAIKIVHMYPGNPEAWSVLVGILKLG